MSTHEAFDAQLRQYSLDGNDAAMMTTIAAWERHGATRRRIKNALVVLVYRDISPVCHGVHFELLSQLSTWRQTGDINVLHHACYTIAHAEYRVQDITRWVIPFISMPQALPDLRRSLSDSDHYIRMMCRSCPFCPNQPWIGDDIDLDDMPSESSPDAFDSPYEAELRPPTCDVCRPWGSRVRRLMGEFHHAVDTNPIMVYTIAYEISVLDRKDDVSYHDVNGESPQRTPSSRARSDSMLFVWLATHYPNDVRYQTHCKHLRDLYYLFDADRFVFLMHAVYLFMITREQ
jgi:hypothetical protein